MIEPIQADDELLADIRSARQETGHFRLWWFGQSGFLIAWQEKYLLLDPYLSDSLTHKYAHTEQPHVRLIRRVIDPARLDFINVVTSSHNHTDHLDAETLGPLLEASPNCTVVVPAANQSFAAERLGVPLERLTTIDAGDSLAVAGFRLHAIPAAHEEIDRDEQGRCRYLGLIIQCGPWTIYHSGDTVRYAGQVELLCQFKVQLALLPINGRSPERRVAGNLWGREAAELAAEGGVDVIIPCHFEMFEFNTATTDEVRGRAQELNLICHVLRCGESFSSDLIPTRQAENLARE